MVAVLTPPRMTAASTAVMSSMDGGGDVVFMLMHQHSLHSRQTM
jgi:hypothetical protein